MKNVFFITCFFGYTLNLFGQADKILRQSLEKMGGLTKWEQIRGIKTEYRSFQENSDSFVMTTAHYQLPHNTHYKNYHPKTEKYSYLATNTEKRWSKMPHHSVEEFDVPKTDVFKDHLGWLLVELCKTSYQTELLKDTTLFNKVCFSIKFQVRENLYYLFIEKASLLPFAFASEENCTFFESYQKNLQFNVMLPHKKEIYIKTWKRNTRTTIIIDKVELNPNINEKLFEKLEDE